jgi:hypothetical protein
MSDRGALHMHSAALRGRQYDRTRAHAPALERRREADAVAEQRETREVSGGRLAAVSRSMVRRRKTGNSSQNLLQRINAVFVWIACG